MKQKMVIDVSMSNGQKSHSRALQIVTGFEGVLKASLGEKDKSKIEVVAEGVDPVKVTNSLRKKMEKKKIKKIIGCLLGKSRIRVHAQLISVTLIDEKKEEEKEKQKPILWTVPHQGLYMPQYIGYV